MDWQKYLKPEAWHPAAKLFPLMGEKELNELAEDIKRNRLLHPITMLGDLVLDGRNRLLACARACVEPWFAQWAEKKMSPTEWIISQNLRRRHLTPSQAAVVALEAMALLREEAKERQRFHGGTAPGKHKTLGQTFVEVSDSDANMGKAAERAAILCNTNRQYVQDARFVSEKDPELAEAIKRGEITIPEAKRRLGIAQRRVTISFIPGTSADDQILRFVDSLPKGAISDTLKEVILKGLEEEHPARRQPPPEPEGKDIGLSAPKLPWRDDEAESKIDEVIEGLFK